MRQERNVFKIRSEKRKKEPLPQAGGKVRTKPLRAAGGGSKRRTTGKAGAERSKSTAGRRRWKKTKEKLRGEPRKKQPYCEPVICTLLTLEV